MENKLNSIYSCGFIFDFRNVIPDNIFQASIQQAHTVYLPKDSLAHAFNETVNETLPLVSEINVATMQQQSQQLVPAEPLTTSSEPQPELIRVVQYRSGTNTLGIVFFCLVFGTFLGMIGNKGRIVVDFFSAIFDVVMKMVTCVMWLTPIGISSVIAGKILSVNDLHLVMAQLIWFILTVTVGILLYQLIIMQAIYYVFVRKNPFRFYTGLMQAMLTAFATAST